MMGYWLIPALIAVVCVLLLYLDDRRERKKFRNKSLERLK